MPRHYLYKALLWAGAISALALPILTFATSRWHPFILLAALVPLSFLVAGVLAFSHRAAHRAAQRLLAIGALHLVAFTLSAVTVLLPVEPGLRWVPNLMSSICYYLGFAAMLGLFAVFPDGSYQRRVDRRIVRGFTFAAVITPILAVFSNATQETVLHLETPVTEVASPLLITALASLPDLTPVMFLAPVLGLLLLIVRYRYASAEQRAQMRWPLSSATLLILAIVTSPGITSLLGSGAQAVIFLVVAMSFPATLVIGMRRDRLFDIDLIIRKSLVYAVLWIAIALFYTSITAVLGITASQYLPVGIAIILTIVAAMAFQPARQWLESMADQRVFGLRTNGYELIQQFGATLEKTPALEDLAPRLASTVQLGLNACWVKVRLRHMQNGTTSDQPVGAARIGLHESAAAALEVALVHDGEQVGVVECGPKAEGGYTPKDRDLLETLARQAALAIRNARLAADLADRVALLDAQTEELRASRVRIVQAAEAERRRIERDIHDGVQQEVVALLARLALVRTQLGPGAGPLDGLLGGLQDAVRQIHADLRELARGIHPAVLGDRGLEEAIEARVARFPIGVTVESDLTAKNLRFAQEIEGAAYFLIAEALTNVMKHAATNQALVRLNAQEDRLRVEIEDKGCGFDPALVTPQGLRGLKDRIEALGGTFEVMTQPGAGTKITGILPAHSYAYA